MLDSHYLVRIKWIWYKVNTHQAITTSNITLKKTNKMITHY